MSLADTQTASFYPDHFTKYSFVHFLSFLLGLPTLEDALLRHVPNDVHKVGRLPNYFRVIGPQGVVLKWL
jgi:hypothetical protein